MIKQLFNPFPEFLPVKLKFKVKAYALNFYYAKVAP